VRFGFRGGVDLRESDVFAARRRYARDDRVEMPRLFGISVRNRYSSFSTHSHVAHFFHLRVKMAEDTAFPFGTKSTAVVLQYSLPGAASNIHVHGTASQ
jgi:hypothetical protein